MKTTMNIRLFLLLLMFCLISSNSIFSQDDPVTCEEIIILLESGMEHQEIIQLLKNIKTTCDFSNNTEMVILLANAGADQNLLDAIIQYKYAELIITTPHSGDDVGSTIRIEGTSISINDKHLWVFLQREGLQVWWPQGGEIMVKSNGSWRQGAFVGSSKDIGFDFNITALWVDNNVNRELKDYIAETSVSGNYYGIPLPEGSPSATIIVHKTRH